MESQAYNDSKAYLLDARRRLFPKIFRKYNGELVLKNSFPKIYNDNPFTYSSADKQIIRDLGNLTKSAVYFNKFNNENHIDFKNSSEDNQQALEAYKIFSSHLEHMRQRVLVSNLFEKTIRKGYCIPVILMLTLYSIYYASCTIYVHYPN